VGFTFGWILSGFKCSEAPWSGKGRWVGGGEIKEGKQVVVVEEYLDFRSRFRPPKRMDDGTLKVENVVVLFLSICV
jgi:hypothetical protein